jgi:DNA polymerase-1
MPPQLDRKRVLQALKPLLENEEVAKVGQNLKYDALVLRRTGIELRGIVFDTMIASYLTEPATRSHALDRLALEYLGHKMISYGEVTADGKKKKNFAQVDIPSATDYAAEDADMTLRLKNRLAAQLREYRVEKLFNEIEMPLLPVLTTMEWNGIRIDAGLLADFSGEMAQQLENLARKIYELAGVEFNIGSPKQLGEVLFEKLSLPTGKRTKTGWSTDVEVLTRLAADHEICSKLLEYRSASKLKSTYTDALPQLVNPETGRIHTSFNQTVTVTGRLSSSGPNLQNIPVRTVEGRRIREAFIPAPGCLLLSADYSQVELRILAHMAQEEALISGFARGEDIHRRTAGEVLGIDPGAVTREQRRDAKAINFGIIYGMSAFGLARELNIGRKEAQDYINRYFARYPKVKAFMEARLNEARKNKCLYTLFDRRLPLPEIDSKNSAVRGNAERNAINYPIQGSAADIIKVAMIRIDRSLTEKKLATRMVLQVHDELLFEVPEEELDAVRTLVNERMENAVTLDVPLQVDIGVGKNWSDAH